MSIHKMVNKADIVLILVTDNYTNELLIQDSKPTRELDAVALAKKPVALVISEELSPRGKEIMEESFKDMRVLGRLDFNPSVTLEKRFDGISDWMNKMLDIDE